MEDDKILLNAEIQQRTVDLSQEILSVKKLCHGFDKTHSELLVLDDVNLTLYEGEIVGLLGRSGSGKSTLLRILAGLLIPTSGEVNYLGQSLEGPAKGIAMVFQTFALFPWLTVMQNVEVGLEAQGIAAAERRTRALAAIDLIGLGGFENAYPRELSGGMRQRVGFARALVVDPTLLLMDEPFSALDVLTAETLRSDLLDLWSQGKVPIKSVLIVTHNIEEAVFMCDRILLFSSNPGRVIAEIKVPFKHPRDRQDPVFRQLSDDVYAKMTAQPTNDNVKKGLKLGSKLPHISTNLIAGLIETLAAATYHGNADMRNIAHALHLKGEHLFTIAEVLQLLGFAEVRKGERSLSPQARVFAESDTQSRKVIFAEHLLLYVPLAALIKNVLDERPGHRAPRIRFEQELEDFLLDNAAKETLDTVINWGRYAEIFSYDDRTEFFSLKDAGDVGR